MKEQPLNVTALPGKPVLQGSGNPWHQVLEFSHQFEPHFPVHAWLLLLEVTSPDQSSAASLSDHLILAPDFSCSLFSYLLALPATVLPHTFAVQRLPKGGTETW